MSSNLLRSRSLEPQPSGLTFPTSSHLSISSALNPFNLSFHFYLSQIQPSDIMAAQDSADGSAKFILDAIYCGGAGLEMDFKEVAKVHGISLASNA